MENLPIIPTIAGVALAAVVSFLIGCSGRGALRARLELAQSEALQKLDDQHRKAMAKMRREAASFKNLALALPPVVRKLNRDDLDPTGVPRLILQLAEAMFEPQQILLYTIRNNGDKRTLTLIDQHGLDEVPDELKTIPVGYGKIGWVAKHELDMLSEDWQTLGRTERVDVRGNHRILQSDIIGPLLKQSKNRQRVLGVLCIGGSKIHPQNEKLMFQMVTNLGSLALVNAVNIKRLRISAHHDGLTKLLNKKFFLDQLATNSLIKCERSGRPFSIFIFDIDHFKNFNDTKGHPAGDDLLRGMGKLIKANMRSGDLVCRYGGEEFVVAMPETDSATALRHADSIRAAVESHPFEHRESQPAGMISVSGGVATFPRDGSSVAELLQHADQALYISKKGGRNRVASYKGVEIGDPAMASSESAIDIAVESTAESDPPSLG